MHERKRKLKYEGRRKKRKAFSNEDVKHLQIVRDYP